MAIRIEIEQRVMSAHGGWKKFAQYIHKNIPEPYECKLINTLPAGGPIAWVLEAGTARCGYRTNSKCKRTQNINHAIGFLKVTLGVDWGGIGFSWTPNWG